jgi:hypothetical protein
MNKNFYIDSSEGLSTPLNNTLTVSDNCGISWTWVGGTDINPIPQQKSNPHIPERIYCNSFTKTTIVKWNDGTETKVTCDPEDNFSPESGYFAALAIKIFGNDKKKFKDFWYPVISRRVILDGKKTKPVDYGKWEKQRKETKRK